VTRDVEEGELSILNVFYVSIRDLPSVVPRLKCPLVNQIEMSPMRIMTESSHSLFSVEGVLLCREFGQGRAPYLRAPEGSLDGTNGTAHNAETGNGWTPPCVRGHFYRGHKGT